LRQRVAQRRTRLALVAEAVEEQLVLMRKPAALV
jgi:hypothetical protein